MTIIKNVSAPRANIEPNDTILKCNCAASAVAVSFIYASSSYQNAITIKKSDSGANAVTITPHTGDTIDGASTYTISLENGYVTLAPTRGGWTAIDSYTVTPSYTSPVLTTPVIADGDAGCTITSANQTNASATVTIPNFTDAADEFVLKDTAQTLTLKTLTTPVVASIYQDAGKTKLMTLPNAASDTLVSLAATQTLTNKSLTAPTITGSATMSKLNPVAATGVLTVGGVVKDSETVTIGTDVYEFCSDVAQSKTAPTNIAVDITANTTKSTGTLTVAVNPSATETITIGVAGATTVYTFRATADFDAAGEIELGENVAATQVNIVAAIMGTDGVNTANTDVTIGTFADNAATLTALVGGTIGNTITTTETMAGEGNAFGAGTLGSGADCSAANAIIALVAAVTASDTQGVGAADGTGDIVDLTADTAGAAGNAIVTTETLSNGSFGAVTLAGGTDNKILTPIITNPHIQITAGSHDYASGTTAWTLTPTELLKPYHKVVGAGGAVDAVIPLTPSVIYTFNNASGQALTVKGASGTGTEIANTKVAMVMSDGTNVIRITADA